MSELLQDKLIVLTRSATDNSSWGSYLKSRGARVYSLPSIETIPLPLTPDVTEVLKRLADFDWMILTSPVSVRYLLDLADQSGVSLKQKSLKVAVIGDETARTARQAGMNVAFQPSHSDSATLASELDIAQGIEILWPHATRASLSFVTALSSRGARVTEFPLYETRNLDSLDEELSQLLKNAAVDFLVFASSSAVEGFGGRLTGQDWRVACNLPAIAIGPKVAKSLVRAGYKQVFTSNLQSIAGIASVLERLSKQY